MSLKHFHAFFLLTSFYTFLLPFTITSRTCLIKSNHSLPHFYVLDTPMLRGFQALGALSVGALASSSASSQIIHSFNIEISSAVDWLKQSLDNLNTDSQANSEISSSIVNRVTRKAKALSPSSTIPLPNPTPNPTENYTKKYREFNEKVRLILEKYRVEANTPGITAAVHFNPDCAKYAAPPSIFDLDDDQDALNQSKSSVSSFCMCGEIGCACTPRSCKPCALKTLQLPVNRSGFVVWEGASGLSDIELGVAMRPSTKVKIASISKTLTAILCARLIDAGLLDLDSTLSELLHKGNYWTIVSSALAREHGIDNALRNPPSSPIGVTVQGSVGGSTRNLYSTSVPHSPSHLFPLPSFDTAPVVVSGQELSGADEYVALPSYYNNITLRQLLNHTSGIRGYTGDEFLSSRAYPTAASTMLPFLRDPLAHPPGERFSYTTHGYSPIAVAIEAVVANAAKTPHEAEIDMGIEACSHFSELLTGSFPPSFSDFKTKSFVSILQRFLVKPLGLQDTLPCPPAGMFVLNRSKQYTRASHSPLPQEVLDVFSDISSTTNNAIGSKHTLIRVGSNNNFNLVEGGSNLVSGNNPCGLSRPVYLSPYTDVSNKYAGGGYLSSARDIAIFGGSLTGNKPLVDPGLLAKFWTPLTVPIKPSETTSSSPDVSKKKIAYGLGFSILPSGENVETVTSSGVDISSSIYIPNAGVKKDSEKESATTHNTSGQLISSDVNLNTKGPWWSGRALGHSGQAIDSSSYLLVMPEEGITVSVLANIDRCNLKPVALEIAKEFHKAVTDGI